MAATQSGVIYASAPSRLGAFLADLAIIYLVATLLWNLVLGSLWSKLGAVLWGGMPHFSPQEIRMLGVPLAVAASAIFYFPVAESWRGKTFGKWLFGITVTRVSGERPDWGRALFRRVPLYIVFTTLGILSAIEALWVLVSDKHQRVFDILADTIVVQDTERNRIHAWGIAAGLILIASLLTAMMLRAAF